MKSKIFLSCLGLLLGMFQIRAENETTVYQDDQFRFEYPAGSSVSVDEKTKNITVTASSQLCRVSIGGFAEKKSAEKPTSVLKKILVEILEVDAREATPVQTALSKRWNATAGILVARRGSTPAGLVVQQLNYALARDTRDKRHIILLTLESAAEAECVSQLIAVVDRTFRVTAK